MKKGFTLVELIAVISVLALIILVVGPGITNTLKKGKTDSKIQEINNIYIATESYITNENLFNNLINPNDSLIIYIKDLKSENYLKYDLKNPKTDLSFTDKHAVKAIKQSDNTIKYYNNFKDENNYEE